MMRTSVPNMKNKFGDDTVRESVFHLAHADEGKPAVAKSEVRINFCL